MSDPVDGTKIANAITKIMNVMETLNVAERDRLTAVIATHYLGKESTLQMREAAIRIRMDQMREAAGIVVNIPLIGTTRDEQPVYQFQTTDRDHELHVRDRNRVPWCMQCRTDQYKDRLEHEMSKNSGSNDDKAPNTGAGSTQRRDDKATSDGRPVDPNRPHTDK